MVRRSIGQALLPLVEFKVAQWTALSIRALRVSFWLCGSQKGERNKVGTAQVLIRAYAMLRAPSAAGGVSDRHKLQVLQLRWAKARDAPRAQLCRALTGLYS